MKQMKDTKKRTNQDVLTSVLNKEDFTAENAETAEKN